MHDELLQKLNEHGCRGRIVSLECLKDLEEAFRELRLRGLIDGRIDEEEIGRFSFQPPAALPGARSVIVLAMPQPLRVITFRRRGKAVRCSIPPSYFEEPIHRHLRALAAELLAPAGFRVTPAELPLKLLAVRSGLAAYGKNNITYIPGLGSYNALTAVFSDLPPGADTWRPPAVMEACARCSACARACPTGAVDPGRFQLHAERCLSYHNERPSEEAFPDWMDPGWHDCLVGCMLCQRACPQNREHPPAVVEAAEFTDEETALLLADGGRLTPAVRAKLARAGMETLTTVLPRNLRVLLDSDPA